jgi:hypothetical protein
VRGSTIAYRRKAAAHVLSSKFARLPRRPGLPARRPALRIPSGVVQPLHPTTTAEPSGPPVTRVEAGGLVAVAVVTVVGATQTDYVAPILAFVAALIVAILTAITTSRRQTHQLAEDARRQERVLDAERGRLDAQLSHDREMADVADLRNVLDDATTVLQAAYNCSARGNRGESQEIMRELRRQSARLSVRLGENALITNSLELAGDAFEDLWIYRSGRGPDNKPVPHENGQQVKFNRERSAFEAAAVQLAGMRLGSPPGRGVGTTDPATAG